LSLHIQEPIQVLVRGLTPLLSAGILSKMQTSFDELREAVIALPRSDKMRLLVDMAGDLGDTFPGIAADPRICGGSPRISHTRIPVWTLEQARRLGLSEVEILQAFPSLHAEDLVHAWAYSRSHRAEVDRGIAENEAE